MHTLINKLLLTLFFLTLSLCFSHADDSHYINCNVGDRASGMAGAYTAISDDSSGCYYNPAGIALAPSNKFSASVNAIGSSTKVYKDVLQSTTGGSLDWEQKSFSLLPNYFGIVQEFGPGMLGFSYAVPESVQMRQKQTFANIQGASLIDTFTVNLNNSDKTYLFGPSYGYKVSDSLSLGGTLYYYYRDVEIITNQFIRFASGDDVISNQYSTRTDQGIKPMLGLIWDPVDNLSLGFTVSKLFLIDNETEIQTIQNNDPTPADFNLFNIKHSDKDKYPLSASLGLAWFYSPKLLFSWDLKYFDSEDEKVYVINTALGAEYYTSDRFAFRAGFYTDISNAEDVSSTEPSYSDQINIYGLTASGTFFSGKSSISLGIDYGFGQGEAQVFADSYSVYDVDYSNITVHISTSFSY